MLILRIGEHRSGRVQAQPSRQRILRHMEIVRYHPAGRLPRGLLGAGQPDGVPGCFVQQHIAFEQGKRRFAVGALRNFARAAVGESSGGEGAVVVFSGLPCGFAQRIVVKPFAANISARHKPCGGVPPGDDFAGIDVDELAELTVAGKGSAQRHPPAAARSVRPR